MTVARRRRSIGGDQLRLARLVAVVLLGARIVDPPRELRRLGLAPIALGRPVGLILLLVILVIGAPVVVGLLPLRPVGALLRDLPAARGPVRLGHRLAPVVLCGLPHRRGAREVAAGEVGPTEGLVRPQQPAVRSVDGDERPPVVTVGVAAVADQVGVLGA